MEKMQNIRTIINRWNVAEQATVGDSVSGRVQWHGGRGFLSVGSIEIDREPTAIFSAHINWSRHDLPNGGSVLAQNPVNGGGIYPFEAPEGELNVSIAVTTAGYVDIRNIHIVW
jgi:hypothetical protein